SATAHAMAALGNDAAWKAITNTEGAGWWNPKTAGPAGMQTPWTMMKPTADRLQQSGVNNLRASQNNLKASENNLKASQVIRLDPINVTASPLPPSAEAMP